MCHMTLFCQSPSKTVTSCVLCVCDLHVCVCVCVRVCLCVSVLYFVPCDFVLPESRCKGHQLCCRPKQGKPSQGKQWLRQRRTSQIQIYTQSKSKTENNPALLLSCGQWYILDMCHHDWWNTTLHTSFKTFPHTRQGEEYSHGLMDRTTKSAKFYLMSPFQFEPHLSW